MKVIFSAKDNPYEWFTSLAKGFGTKVENNTIEIPASLGKGFLKQLYFFDGLTLTYLHFNLNETLELVRHSKNDARLIPIMFYNQDIPLEQDIDEQKKLIGYHTSNGIFMSSPQIESKWTIPRKVEGYQVTLTFDKNWFLETLNNADDIYINRLLKSGKAFYLFESLLPSMKKLILSVHSLINSNDTLKDLKLHQIGMELFNLFVCQVQKRDLNYNISGIDPADIDKVFIVRKILLENLSDIPLLKELALGVGLSVSKMQKTFQQVFGKSVSQYAITEKMNLAKRWLESRKYSVSEVGYKAGYSNLSHFTKAFYKEFGINPKTYLSELK